MSKDNQSDKKLLESVQADSKNFDEVYEKYYKKLVNYLRSRLSEKALAEDLASEVFEKAFKTIKDFKWQGISLSAWIFRIARNLLTDHYRKVGRRGKTVSLTEIEDLFEDDKVSLKNEVVKDEQDVAIYNAMREFGDEDQYLLYYKFFEELSNKEIAKLMKISESNVGTRLYRIRKKLQEILNSSKLTQE
jgi:RNA polymerase sigma factor (sigma-70 family)